ncbi:hypothetical protein [Ruania halotolerans]|uniref:hypothetical protein n=1 Tax=Ruania halotolerans TaxID=2897773 RepID=UPI001E57648E|nr:hypothetical protein [Ruania halotolerans]UFU07963.1 hypothetical protein LQF10_07655 [Ruania halotolerans]
MVMQQGTLAQGEQILRMLREAAGQQCGLRPGRDNRLRLILGLVVLTASVGVVAVELISRAPVESEQSARSSAWLILGALAAMLSVHVILQGIAPGTVSRIKVRMTIVATIAGYSTGLIGLALALFTSCVILYGLVIEPDFMSTYPDLVLNLMVSFVLSGLLAVLTVLDLDPVVAINGRSGNSSSVWRVRLAASICSVSLAISIVLAGRTTTLGELVPPLLAATVVSGAMRGVITYRRRLDAIRREIVERLTDVVVAGLNARDAEGRRNVVTAMMHLENVLAPCGEESRWVPVIRADAELRGLIGYFIDRFHKRESSLRRDLRFAYLDCYHGESLVQAAVGVADRLRWGLAAPGPYSIGSGQPNVVGGPSNRTAGSQPSNSHIRRNVAAPDVAASSLRIRSR